MTTSPLAVPAASSITLRESAPVLLAGLLGLAVWALLFHTEAVAAVNVWYDSTAYSHCFFVLPIAAWLAWDRRDAARGLRPLPTLWPLLALLPGALAWFAAERLGIMEGRQLAATGMVIVLAVSLLGWRLAWEFSSPLLYLLFLVPFGSFLTPDLQVITAWFTETGLMLLGIPHVLDVFTIEVPGAMFYIAEACAGLRFLIASIAFGVLYACLTYRSPWRRLAFILASCTVPIVANGFRALGIVVAGYLLGSAEAAAADHIIYGWGFFSVVIVLLTLAGLPFRQDHLPPPPRAAIAASRPAGVAQALGVVCAAALLMALAPLVSAQLDHSGAPPAVTLPGFAATRGCVDMGDRPALTDGKLVQHFSCGGVALAATVQVLPSRATPAALRAARSAATGEHDSADAVTSTLTLDSGPARSWRLVEIHEPGSMTATAVWTRGAPDPGGLAGRVRMAWDSAMGGAPPPVLAAASLTDVHVLHAQEREAARAILQEFLAAQEPLLTAIQAIRP